MQEPLTDGVIRKLWIDRAGPYRDHLLRLDKDSRRNRFGGVDPYPARAESRAKREGENGPRSIGLPRP